MKRAIAGGILATRAVPKFLIGALSEAFGYVGSHAWLRWGVAALAGAAVCISGTDLWGYVARHAGMLLLPLPVLLAGWLVIGAEEARQMQRPMRTCRRR